MAENKKTIELSIDISRAVESLEKLEEAAKQAAGSLEKWLSQWEILSVTEKTTEFRRREPESPQSDSSSSQSG